MTTSSLEIDRIADWSSSWQIHLIVFGPSFALQHGKAPYFSAALNRIRDQIIDVRNSSVHLAVPDYNSAS